MSTALPAAKALRYTHTSSIRPDVVIGPLYDEPTLQQWLHGTLAAAPCGMEVSVEDVTDDTEFTIRPDEIARLGVLEIAALLVEENKVTFPAFPHLHTLVTTAHGAGPGKQMWRCAETHMRNGFAGSVASDGSEAADDL